MPRPSRRARSQWLERLIAPYEYDWVRVAGGTDVGIVELVVDPSGAADLVVDGPGEPGRHRLAGSSSQYAGTVDCRRLAGRAGYMVIELLGRGQSDPIG
jgi:hypothetical protein